MYHGAGIQNLSSILSEGLRIDAPLNYGEEDDYETTEEYDKAVEHWEEYESEARDEAYLGIVRGGASHEGSKAIQELREQGVIPSWEKMHQKEEKVAV